MNIDKTNFCLRRKFLEYFIKNDIMQIGDMYFRVYDPSKDQIVDNYSKEDWHKILGNTTEEDLKDLYNCSNVVILLWCDKASDSSHGMVYLEEDIKQPCNVIFHGGTWDHNPKYFTKIFHSLIRIFDFILKFKASILTTCGITNITADKFQQGLCFEETKRDDVSIYKTLNKQLFRDSRFINKLRTPKNETIQKFNG